MFLTSGNCVHAIRAKVKVSMCLQYIEQFRTLAKEIISLPTVEHFDMIELDCDDLKRGLSEAAKKLAEQLLDRVAADHRAENKA